MRIGGLQKLTLIDFPDTLACTVFLAGCNFRCPWCYSPELVLPQYIQEQPGIEEKEFFHFLNSKKGLIDGVVICGGEPTLQEGLPLFCSKIKNLGYKVKLDTNGSNPAMLEKLLQLKLVDYVAMDVKAPKTRYVQAVGFANDSGYYLAEKIEKSISLLKNSSIDYEFRTTVVPGVHSKKDIVEIALWLKPAKRYFLQNFRPEKTLNPLFERYVPFEKEEMYQMREAIMPFFDMVGVR